jgi:hypothetical protein
MHNAYKKGFISSAATDDILTGADPENAHKDVRERRRAFVQTKAPTQDISHTERARAIWELRYLHHPLFLFLFLLRLSPLLNKPPSCATRAPH